jgi:acetyl-CoA carboxylase carboxyl transferase subunit alpha
MLQQRLIDGIVAEPVGGAHTFPEEMYRIAKQEIMKCLDELGRLTTDDLVKSRIDKFCSMGAYAEAEMSA